jgi:hypothetical protein
MVVNNTRSLRLARQVDVACNFWRRLRGLMFRASLPVDRGLLIAPCRSVHTLHMRFPIDVIFLDKSARVVGLETQLPPWRFSRIYPQAWFALELPAGMIQSSGTQIGDLLEFVGSM